MRGASTGLARNRSLPDPMAGESGWYVGSAWRRARFKGWVKSHSGRAEQIKSYHHLHLSPPHRQELQKHPLEHQPTDLTDPNPTRAPQQQVGCGKGPEEQMSRPWGRRREGRRRRSGRGVFDSFLARHGMEFCAAHAFFSSSSRCFTYVVDRGRYTAALADLPSCLSRFGLPVEVPKKRDR